MRGSKSVSNKKSVGLVLHGRLTHVRYGKNEAALLFSMTDHKIWIHIYSAFSEEEKLKICNQKLLRI